MRLNQLRGRGKALSFLELHRLRTKLFHIRVRKKIEIKELMQLRGEKRHAMLAPLRRQVRDELPDDVHAQTARDKVYLEYKGLKDDEQKGYKVRDRYFDPDAGVRPAPGVKKDP